MIVIYGTRCYGRVDAHGGQHHQTRFFHIYYVPLIPVESVWVTDSDSEGRYRGHDVRMSGRSVLAGYARVWGPLGAVACIASGGVGGIAAGVALGAVSVWTWTWRSLRSARDRRRSDFHQLAFGTRCDPLAMDEALATSLQPHIAQRWAQVSEGNSPEDVARLGASNPAQALMAYASLRLAARLAPGRHAAAARADSERILDSIKDDPSQIGAGPYRSAPLPGASDPDP
jgi:hypothetical protein